MHSLTLVAPFPGWLSSLADVPDPVFAEGMMGDGVAIDPLDGTVNAPCDGTILLVAPTGHSVTLRSPGGAELLIHIGVETVGIGRDAFQVHVADGQAVRAGEPLITFDMDSVGLQAKSLVTPVLLTNETGFEFTPATTGALVERGQLIGTVTATAASKAASPAIGSKSSAEAILGLEHGIHARPAARIAACARQFQSAVELRVEDRRASARSPIALMALDVRQGARIEIAAEGPDSKAAVDALRTLIETGLEDDGRTASPAPAPAPGATAPDGELFGVCAVPGQAVGTAIHWKPSLPEIPEQGEGAAIELERLAGAVSKLRDRLAASSAQDSGIAGSIAGAQLALLEDDELQAPARELIAAGKSAGFAWRCSVRKVADRFRATGNTVIGERIEDLEDLERQVLLGLGNAGAGSAPALPDPAILLAGELLPSELMALDKRRLAGLCLSRSGPTSHAAIIAASMAVPTLVAMGPGLNDIADGTPLLLDSTAGKLIVDPDPELAAEIESTEPAAAVSGDCTTVDGERVVLLANLGSVDEAGPALAAGAEGCGLLRTEFLFLDRPTAPDEDEQSRTYHAIAEALGKRPLTIRTLDIGGDKPVDYLPLPREENPALGVRGIRTGLLKTELLDQQLRAILAVQGPTRPRIMLPMITSIAELRAVRSRLDTLEPGTRVELGLMIETPAAALLTEQLAAEADFFSIGTNDLAQYALAMDRANPLLAAQVDALHPAVLRLIALTVEGAEKNGKPVAVCGGLASDPLGARILVGLGIRELSVVPAAIGAIKASLRSVTLEQCQALAGQALEADSAATVRHLAARSTQASGETQ